MVDRMDGLGWVYWLKNREQGLRVWGTGISDEPAERVITVVFGCVNVLVKVVIYGELRELVRGYGD